VGVVDGADETDGANDLDVEPAGCERSRSLLHATAPEQAHTIRVIEISRFISR
jgi:hypothetical protein